MSNYTLFANFLHNHQVSNLSMTNCCLKYPQLHISAVLSVHMETVANIFCLTEIRKRKLVCKKTARTCSYVGHPPYLFLDTSSMEYVDLAWSAWVAGDAGNYLHDMVE